uniref:Uncharacterized protein n=1 Tax=Amphimedon queenslandica TaxID=400682 RepID=A0A1X7UML3_AMPQE
MVHMLFLINKRPDSGPGRVVNMGLYEGGRPFIIVPSVIGYSVVLMLKCLFLTR